MPLYEYECVTCGCFDLFRPVNQAAKPAACPACSAGATRVWTAPAVRTMSPPNRMAAQRNEKSSHEPHVCKSSCGCSTKKKPKKVGAEKNVLQLAGGRTRQAYTGSRPWVIEH